MVEEKKKKVAEGLEGMKDLDKGNEKTNNSGKETVDTGKTENDESEVDALKKQLEEEKKRAAELKKEKAEAEEKNKSLAEIIENVSSKEDKPQPQEPVEPKLRELEKRMTEQFQAQMKTLSDNLVAIGTKLEKAGRAGEDKKARDSLDKLQSETTSKISAIEDSIKKLTEKVTAPPPGKGGEVSKGLSAFGGSVELQSELEGVKKEVKDLEKMLVETRDESETKFERIKEQMKRIEKLPSLEERVQTLVEKLGPENIERLRKLIISTEELSDHVIPQEISKSLTKELSPVTDDIKNLKGEAAKLNERIKRVYNELSYFKGEIKTLYKFGDYISGLQSDRDKTRQELKDREAKILERIADMELKLRGKTNEISDKMKAFKKEFSGVVEDTVNKLFKDMAETRLSEVEDRTGKELNVVKDEMTTISSRITQFENVVNPTLDMMREKLDEFENVLARVQDFQENINLRVEKNIEKKFNDFSKPKLSEIEGRVSKAIETLDEKMEELRSDFSQFADVINPSMKMFRGELEKFEGRTEKLKEAQSNIEEKVKEIRSENKELFRIIGSLEDIKKSINTLDGKTKQIDDVKGLLERKISEVDDKLETLDDQLGEQKEFLKRIDQIEKTLGDSISSQSKLRDTVLVMEKKIEGNRNLFEDGIDDLKNEKSQLENTVKPELESFRNDLGRFADALEKFKERQGKLKTDLKDTKADSKDLFKRFGSLQSYTQDVSKLQKTMMDVEEFMKSFSDKSERMNENIKHLAERISSAKKSIEGLNEKFNRLKEVRTSQEKVGKKVGKLEKELANMRAQFDNVVEQSLLDRKKLEETVRKQKERVNSLLRELRG